MQICFKTDCSKLSTAFKNKWGGGNRQSFFFNKRNYVKHLGSKERLSSKFKTRKERLEKITQHIGKYNRVGSKCSITYTYVIYINI